MTALSSTTINRLEDLRTVTQKFFDEQELTVQQVVSVFTQELPASIIAFQYYGSSQLGSSIAELNQTINVSNVSGDIEIFTT